MKRLLLCIILMALNLTAIASDKALKQSLLQGLDALEQQNYDQAAKWFVEAADQGDAEAQFQLALLILNEQNLTINYPVQARELMNQAADQGHPEALTWLQNASSTTAVNLSTNTAVNPDAGASSDTEVNLDPGTSSDVEVSPDAGASSDAVVNPDAGASSDTEVNPDLGTSSDVEVSPDAGASSDTEVNPDPRTSSDVEVSPNAGASSDVELSPDVEVNSAAEVDLDTEDEEEANPEDDC
jgi:hypothetical protein